MVDASFMQTLWNMNPVCSGCELAEGKLKTPAFLKPTFCLPYKVGHFIGIRAAGFWGKNLIVSFLIKIAMLFNPVVLLTWWPKIKKKFYHFNETNILYF